MTPSDAAASVIARVRRRNPDHDPREHHVRAFLDIQR
jgi:hypothetical protein